MKTIYVAILSSIFIFQSLAQTTIPGGIITDLDWTIAESPYEITGDITLDWFDDLIIEPGVEVIFQDEYLFTVHGDLLAEGTLTDSILFTIQDTTGFTSGSYTGWNGLYFYQSEMGTRLKYCIVEYSKSNGVTTSDFQGPAIEDCLIRNNMGNGILAHTWCKLDLTDVSIQKNKKNGIHIGSNSTLLLDGFAISENDSCGILFKHNSSTPFGNSNLNNGIISLNNKSGLWIENTDVSIDSITIENNSTATDGGGIYSYLSDIAISNCDIINNTALINGGGIFQLSSTNSIIDTEISFNEAQGSGGYQGGGGIYIRYGSLNLTELTFDGNTTNQAGGAIHCEAATIIADTVEISNSTAANVGGGIYSHAGDHIYFYNSQFNNNQSLMGGGVYTSQTSTSYIENVIFFGNKAIDFGGGASFAHSDVSLSNVQFRNDTANIGGGIAIYECSTFQMDHTLIVDNVANDMGGGVLFRDSPGTSAIFSNITFSNNIAVNNGKAIYTSINDNLSLNNCVVWDHLSPAIEGTGIVTATYSDIEGGYTGIGNIDQDPLFVDPLNGDYQISWANFPVGDASKSACIDTGDPFSTNDPDGTTADMGAYYFHQTFTPISGNINDTLKCSESPYYVMGDLTVLAGENLVIEPCVQIIFLGNYHFQVEGRFQALGNAFDSIWFFPEDTIIGWNGIKFLNQNSNGQDISKIEYCNVVFSNGNGIYCEYSDLEIDHSQVKNNNSNGIYMVDGSGLTLQNSNVKKNAGTGLYMHHYSNLTAMNVSVSENANDGIYIFGDCDALLNNISSNYNGGTGLSLITNSTLSFTQGSVSYNLKGGLVIDNGCTNVILQDIDILNNSKTGNGGAILSTYGSHVNGTNLIIDNNTSTNGGGIYLYYSSIILDSVTISNNDADVVSGLGGGIYNFRSTVTLSSSSIQNCNSSTGGGIYAEGDEYEHPYINGTNVLIDDNSANYGGGVYCKYSTVVLDSSIVSNNTGFSYGGGLFADTCTMNLEHIDFIGNTTQDNRGGGIYSRNSDIELDSVYFENNQSFLSGGGIYANNLSLLNISNSDFTQNISSNLSGGAICCNNSTCYLDSIRINNCQALSGGGLTGLNANFYLSKVSITECSANDIGGGIFIYGTSTFICDYVLIADNTSTNEGGGLYLDNTTDADLTNVTISNNSAGGDGKAIFTNSIIPMELKNTIIWPQDFPEIAGSGTVNATYSDIEGGLYPGVGNIYSDPLFSDPINGDYSLTWANYPDPWGIRSPCIDAGDPTSPKDPDSTWSDMGAFYFHQDHTLLAGGNISDTLYCSESPYFIMGDLTIPAGEELLIEPCVRVVFQGYYHLKPEGRLLAMGNETDSIYFYSSDTTNGWQGIMYYNQNTNGQDSSKMEYCNIWYGEKNNGGGILFSNSSDVLISHSTIKYNKAFSYGGGIFTDNGSHPKFYCTEISNNFANYGGGIYVGNGDFEECKINLNYSLSHGGGIYSASSTQISLSSSLIFKNKSSNGYGGGIYSIVSEYELLDSEVFENNSYEGGGGIYQEGGGSNIVNSKIYNNYIASNEVGRCGGGIYLKNSNSFIDESIIEGNVFNNIIGTKGAGIYSYESNLFLDNANLINNEAYAGGGLYAAFSPFSIGNSSFKYNTSTGWGGAIFINNSEGSIINSFIYDNSSNLYGGGIAIDYSLTNIRSTIIKDNMAEIGGGIFVIRSKMYLKNTLVSSNLAEGSGGGIHIYPESGLASIVDMTNVTMTGNTASNEGNAIYNGTSDTLNLTNCIIWNHDSPSISNNGIFNSTYSDIQEGWTGIGNINQDPMFMYPDENIYNLSWLNYPVEDNTKSPCIDTGDPSSPLDPDGTRADMGAYPFVAYQFSPEISSIQDVPNDQGGQVVLNWNKSELDNAEHAIIEKYKIWRLQNWAKTPWEYIGETPAHFWDEYAFIAPTESDSSAAGVPYYTYLISAETDNPYAFYNSRVDSAYSVDNLAPEPPMGLYGYQEESLIKLFWGQAGEDDFDYYAIYKSDDPDNFPINPYVTLSDTIYDDTDLSNDTSYYKLTVFDYNGNESLPSEVLEIVIGKNLDLKVFLEGPFFVTQMIPYLNLGAYIPLVHPFNQPPWNYHGDENVTHIPNSDIVDWVLIEFRDATEPALAGGSTAIYKIVAFLKGDGTIIGLDGMTPPRANLEYNNNLYLVIWHRNHLGIMSSLPVDETLSNYSFDFTDSHEKVYGGIKAHKELNTNIWGMTAADANADGQVDNKDKNDIWWPQIYSTGYYPGDFNMDSEVNLMDLDNLWESNSGKSSFVPE